MTTATALNPKRANVLVEALSNAGKRLGLSQTDLGEIIGKDHSAISRGRLDPESKSGELALLFIRCYRSLFTLVGGDQNQMRHWLYTPNHHTGGTPVDQIKSVQGLVSVLEYLDAMRAKV